MEIKLYKLTLINFANIEHQEFNFNGKNSKLYGENGAGKTTTANSFTWLLFGKNIEGKTIKNIVPKDDAGNEQLELTPTVIAELNINGEAVTLERRSDPVAKKDEYGMTTYTNSRKNKTLVNGVEFKATDYTAYIQQIISEDIFKLITNVNEFPRLNWKDKREILFKISGSVSLREIIEQDSELKELSDFETIQDIEDEGKRIKNALAEKKKELENIPVQISTLHNQISDIPDKDLTADIEKLESEIDELKERKLQQENSGNTLEVKSQINIKQKELIQLKQAQIYEKDNVVRRLENKIKLSESDLQNLESKLANLELDKKQTESNMKYKREEWLKRNTERKELIEKTFEPVTDNVCECCGQDIPADQLEKHNAKHEAEFNKNKSAQLEELEEILNHIANEGKTQSQALANTQKIIEKQQKQINECAEELRLLQGQFNKAVEAREAANNSVEYKTLEEEIKALQDSLKEGTGDNTELVEQLNNDIATKQKELSDMRNQEAKRFMASAVRKDIKDLKADEKSCRAAIEEMTYKQYLLDKFTTARVNATTDKVNNMFDNVKFKMFEEQKNGDIKETCEITVEGVSFDEGLNNASRINGGLEIIEVISKYYGIQAPIFIDNAESVTEVYDTTAQQIKLIVKENEKPLRLELS